MPRLVLRRATVSIVQRDSARRLLGRLQTVCGDQHTARSEWRWLQQHAKATTRIASVQCPTSSPRVVLKRMRHLLYDRIVLRKPLQYILGTQPFLNLELRVQPPILIPRPETEEWTDRLATMLSKRLGQHSTSSSNYNRKPLRILDLCTGTGCIALGLASSLPVQSSELIGVDKSSIAIELARQNYDLHHSLLRNNQITFTQLDLRNTNTATQLQQLIIPSKEEVTTGPGYDIIVSNPPYITQTEYSDLAPEVRDWEDRDALVPSPLKTTIAPIDSLAISFYSLIIQLAPQLLRNDTISASSSSRVDPSKQQQSVEPIPQLVMEIGGAHQVAPIKTLLEKLGCHVWLWHDFAQHPRVILARFPIQLRTINSHKVYKSKPFVLHYKS
ncbi:S-adenosyl-L-methionine-dependent methyltransferase [Syncephalis fuscata]|nr:S-adenosyl-L-methionine-dependent methyltransferase [Syncephalis fuscata]